MIGCIYRDQHGKLTTPTQLIGNRRRFLMLKTQMAEWARINSNLPESEQVIYFTINIVTYGINSKNSYSPLRFWTFLMNRNSMNSKEL